MELATLLQIRDSDTYPPATKCAHGFATGAALVTEPASLGLLGGTTSPVSGDCGRYSCGLLGESDPPSGLLSGVKAGKVMNV